MAAWSDMFSYSCSCAPTTPPTVSTGGCFCGGQIPATLYVSWAAGKEAYVRCDYLPAGATMNYVGPFVPNPNDPNGVRGWAWNGDNWSMQIYYYTGRQACYANLVGGSRADTPFHYGGGVSLGIASCSPFLAYGGGQYQTQGPDGTHYCNANATVSG